MTKQKAGFWLFTTTSIVSFISALLPVVKGEGPTVVFLATGTLFLVLAIASAKKAHNGGNGPPAS
jgi:hypothetical protein